MLECVDASALLAVQLRFVRPVGVDATFGEEVGTPAGNYERRPPVAVCVAAG